MSKKKIPTPLLLILLIFVTFSFLPLQAPQSYAASTSSVTNGSVHLTQDKKNTELLLAELSDEQVRQLLLKELQKQAIEKNTIGTSGGPANIFDRMLTSLSSNTDESERKLQQLLHSIPDIPSDLYRVFLALCPLGNSTFTGAMTNVLLVLLFVSIGLAVEILAKRFILKKYFTFRPERSEQMSNSDRFINGIAGKLPDIIGLLLFFGASYFTFFLFAGINSSLVQLFFLAILLTISLVRATSIVLHLILSPTIPAFRILPLENPSAVKMYRLLIWSLGYIFSSLIFSVVIKRLGATLHTVLLLQLLFATLLLGAAAIAILLYKDQVKDYLAEDNGNRKNTGSWWRKQFAAIWHIPGLLYIIILWVLLVNDIANPDPDQKTRSAFLLSFFIVPLWMVVDQLIQWVVRYAVITLNIYRIDEENTDELNEEELASRENSKQFYLKINQFARTGVFISLLIWLASLWNIKIPFLSNLTAVLLDGVIIMALALFLWRFISSWIEKKIQESVPDEEEESSGDGEFGSTPSRGRSYTLLPMVRKFIGSILVVMVTMTILSSMGVDIGPLLAGAGVIGLAVGFGAQKLVADIFSGFFFLLDDAFRVGEYLTAGSVSGTVETITLRNVMLRHHRGMLQIVPHSELGAITNYMRGGMVVKFNLDFPYDADIDQIRKVIKKVGQAMLKDEELGKDFIQPVKSQGVYQITNSVMTIRVKFTAKPGTHFVIRREAYKRITEALVAKGIYYAHKKVIVDVPGLQNANGSNPLPENQLRTIAESAGAAAALQEEEELASRQRGQNK